MATSPPRCETPSEEALTVAVSSFWIRLGLVALLAAALGALIGLLTVPGARDRLFSTDTATSVPASVGGAFRMMDHQGREVTAETFAGRFMLMTFGFTNSPDLTSSLLQLMAASLDLAGPAAERIVPVFVSLDPERDEPVYLATWVARFHPRLVGLTGSPDAVAAMAEAWRMPYRKVPETFAPQGYVIEHAALIYLMGPQGSYIAHFGPSISTQELALRLKRELSAR